MALDSQARENAIVESIASLIVCASKKEYARNTVIQVFVNVCILVFVGI